MKIVALLLLVATIVAFTHMVIPESSAEYEPTAETVGAPAK